MAESVDIYTQLSQEFGAERWKVKRIIHRINYTTISDAPELKPEDIGPTKVDQLEAWIMEAFEARKKWNNGLITDDEYRSYYLTRAKAVLEVMDGEVSNDA